MIYEKSAPTTCLMALVALTLVAVGSASGEQPPGIQYVAWLQGCWETTSGERTVSEEQWMAPRGASMVGMNRTVRDGRLVELEVMVLREDGDHLAYDARPSGQSPAVFRSRSASETMILFENPEHDFPRIIGYQRGEADSMLAWIEGPAGGQTRRVDFRYRRVACPGSK